MATNDRYNMTRARTIDPTREIEVLHVAPELIQKSRKHCSKYLFIFKKLITEKYSGTAVTIETVTVSGPA